MKHYIAGLFALFCLLRADGAHAYGAIAIGGKSVYGLSAGHATQAEAIRSAEKSCREQSSPFCIASIVFENQHVVVLSNEGYSYFFGIGDTYERASQNAYSACGKSGCRYAFAVVDGGSVTTSLMRSIPERAAIAWE